MGSFQQICLGTICLVAAYLFGNYVNNNPPLHSDAGNPIGVISDAANGLAANGATVGTTTGNIQSRLPIGNLSPIENKPAPIVTMKTPLKSRFAVPSTQTPPTELPFGRVQTNKQLPPPSQLAETSQQPAVAGFLDKPFSSSPFAEPVAVSPTIQVPDFSAIAAEFKNTPIELPNMSRLGGMPSHSNNQAGTNPLENWRNSDPPKARLKQLVQRLPDNEFRNPNFHPPAENPMEPQRYQANKSGEYKLEHRVAPSNGFSQADFEPQLNEDIFGLKPQPRNRHQDRPQNNMDRLEAVSNAPIGDYQYDVPPPVPPEPYGSEERTESGFRGNLTFRPELENRSGNSHSGQTQSRDLAQIDYSTNPQTNSLRQRQSTRLPFRLTEQAKTELVQLRDSADSKIGLESTNFVDHTIRDGETLQSISARYFGSPNYYLDIYLANRNKLRNPADTQAGVSIRVPVYESP